MRKTLVIGALTLGFAIAAPAAYAVAAPSHDQAVGTGTLAQFGDPTAHINANQTRSGPKGSFTITYPDGTLATGSLTCLSVDGNVAFVTGRITEAYGPLQQRNNWSVGSYVVVGVEDNGEPGAAGPDRLNFTRGFAADPGCGPNSDATADFFIVKGNYRVSDAS